MATVGFTVDFSTVMGSMGEGGYILIFFRRGFIFFEKKRK